MSLGTERARFFLFTAIGMIISIILLRSALTIQHYHHKTTNETKTTTESFNISSNICFLSFILLGFSFGSNWTILPATISHWYGKKAVPIGFNVICVMFVIVSAIWDGVGIGTGSSVDKEKKKSNSNFDSDNIGLYILYGSGVMSGISLICGLTLTRIRPCRVDCGITCYDYNINSRNVENELGRTTTV